MSFLYKFSAFIMSIAALVLMCTSLAFAKNDVSALVSDNRGGILSVSHRGDTEHYPENSLDAVLSASEKGASMISVSVRMSKDGVPVLCEEGELFAYCDTDLKSTNDASFTELSEIPYYETDGAVSECKIVSLEKAVKKLRGKSILILDNAWEYRNEIVKFCDENGAFDKVIIRCDESAKDIVSFIEETENRISVIGIYDGAVVMNAISHLNKLSSASQSIVQYESKNYFNEMYKNFTAKRFSAKGKARALAPMYDKDLCGQRDDNVSGWDEMIKRGFSVIETNNIEGLVKYIDECEEEKAALEALEEKAGKVDISLYSSGSARNFTDAVTLCENVLSDGNASLGEIQVAKSQLVQSMKMLTFGEVEDTQRGNLNVTPVKVICTVVFGGLILAGEIYVVKKQKKEKISK